MWLITTFGYFSIVQKNSDRAGGTLTIRARIHGDMELLRAKYLPTLGPTDSSGGADYPYRAKAPRADVAAAFAKALMDLNYSNFKAETAMQLGHRREDAYTEVWMTLRKLQQLDKPPAGGVAAKKPPITTPTPAPAAR